MSGVDVTKAVLLAAGKGTRLGALTATFPKALLPVAGKPIIVHILDGLRAAGITEVMIVTGHAAQTLEAELGNGAGGGMSISYVRQQALEGTAKAVSLARDWVGEERFYVGWGDILVRPENYRRLVKASRLADAAIAVNEVPDPSAGAAVYIDEAMRIERIIEKPPPGTSTTRWNNSGLWVAGPGIWPEVDRLQPSARGEYELPQALAAWIAGGAHVVAVPVEGPWYDIGTPAALEAARTGFQRT